MQTGLRALATTTAAAVLAWGLLSQEGLRMRETEQQYLPIRAGQSQETQPGQERSLEGESRSVLRLAAFRCLSENPRLWSLKT